MGASLSWTVTVTNTSDTTATVKVVLRVKATEATWNGSGQPGWIKIDGTKYSFSHRFNQGSTTTLATKSKSISRTTSSKSIAISASYNTGVSPGIITKSGHTTVSARPKYTVTFNYGYSSIVKTVSVSSGYTTVFPTLTRTGYTFAKWNGTYAAGATTPTVTKAVTYTAKWTENTYKITLAPRNGQANMTVFKKYFTNLTLPVPTIAPTGYEFTGWNTQSDGGGTNYGGSGSGGVYSTNKVTTLYATWRLKQYTITLDYGNNRTENVIKTHDQPLSLPIPIDETGQNTFAGWSYTDGSSQINVGTTLLINENKTLIPIWEENKIPIILHNINGPSSDITSTLYKTQGQNLILPTQGFVSENYIFKGWQYNGQPISTITSDDSIDIYASWAGTYIVALDPGNIDDEIGDGGEIIEKNVTGNWANKVQIVEIGNPVTLPTAGDIYEYRLDEIKATASGWIKDGIGYSNNSSFTPNNVSPGTTYTFTAQWTKNSYIISFYDEPRQRTITETVQYYDFITLILPENWTYSGYHINGWKESVSEAFYNIGFSYLVTGNTTFIPNWIPNYQAPNLNITAIRVASTDSDLVNPTGRYIKVNITGTPGNYASNSTSIIGRNYKVSYTIGEDIEKIEYFNLGNNNNTINYTFYVPDPALVYDKISIIVGDISNYGASIDIPVENRQIAISSIEVPLQRTISAHFALDNSAISLFRELENTDEGLVVDGKISTSNNLNIDGTLYANGAAQVNNLTANGNTIINGGLSLSSTTSSFGEKVLSIQNIQNITSEEDPEVITSTSNIELFSIDNSNNGTILLKNGLTQIYNAPWVNLNNTYYKTDGYHAFYATKTAGVASTGSFYVYGDHLMSTVPFSIKVSGTYYNVQGFTEGSSGDWYYRKWSGGKVEAWYRGNVSCSATTAVGNVYRSTYSLAIPSVIFSSAPIINLAIDQNASTLMSVQGYASSKTAISGYVFRTGKSDDTYNTRVAVYAWTN